MPEGKGETMKATANKKLLTAAVNAAIQAVDRKAKLPILRCVKLMAEDGTFAVQATNLELAVTRHFGALVTTEGSCAVDAAKLKAALKAMPGPNVGLAMGEGGWLRLQSGGVKMDLATLDAAKFPPVPEPEKGWRVFAAPGKVLAELIDKTGFCASTDEGRVNLNGCLLERAETKGEPCLRMVATDEHRMAVAEAPCGAALPGPMLIPRKALKPLAELAEAEMGHELTLAVKIGEYGRGVNLTASGLGAEVAVRLIDKEFPDWTQVVPEGGGPTFMVEAKELIAALKAVTALSRDRSKTVKFEPGTAGDCVVLSATNTDMEAATQRVRVSGMDKPIPVVGFNAKYLIEALAKATGGTVEFVFAEYEPALTPAILMDVCDPHWRYVVVPMRITN